MTGRHSRVIALIGAAAAISVGMAAAVPAAAGQSWGPALGGKAPAATDTRPAPAPGAHTLYPKTGTVAPHSVNNLDCNGYAPNSTPAKPSMKPLCADPIAKDSDGSYYKFVDNGHYIGHDEPSIKFESSAPGSGNHMNYFMQLSKDPGVAPTASGSTSDYAMLSPAPWFGLSLCDPNSNPGGPCTPDSDSNNPNTAGQAFMELQFYPPGFQPFVDNVSCDPTHWCAALNIDSLSCTGGAGCPTFNPNCVEPVNFAFLQDNGVPTGPPSPQLTDLETFTPNTHTLLMNPGDTLNVTLQDTAAGFLTTINDLTTGKTGYMIASAGNGFMTTDSTTCNGSPFSFHPTYDTAKQQNMLPWSVLQGGVLAEQEIGHMETCSSLANAGPTHVLFPNNETFNDLTTQQTCVGGIPESGAGGVGEGPCFNTNTGAVCPNATTEGGLPCPGTPNAGGIPECEGSDATCIPAGARTVTTTSADVPPVVTNTTYTNPLNECEANQSQNGDLDFDGNTYIPDWPDGTTSHPTSIRYIGPFDATGQAYPQVQLETDLLGSEQDCLLSPITTGCSVPPLGPGNAPTFYPYWSLTSSQGLNGLSVDKAGSCAYNFGNTIAGVTTNDLGKDAEYGSADGRGNAISAVQPNPEVSGNCTSLTAADISPTPPNNVPESPLLPALVLAGALGLGVTELGRQRRRRAAATTR